MQNTAKRKRRSTTIDLDLTKTLALTDQFGETNHSIYIYIYIYIYNFSASNLLLFGQQTAGQATLCSVACFGFTGKTAGMMSTKFTLLSVVLISPFFLMVTICDTYFGGVLTQIGPYTPLKKYATANVRLNTSSRMRRMRGAQEKLTVSMLIV